MYNYLIYGYNNAPVRRSGGCGETAHPDTVVLERGETIEWRPLGMGRDQAIREGTCLRRGPHARTMVQCQDAHRSSVVHLVCEHCLDRDSSIEGVGVIGPVTVGRRYYPRDTYAECAYAAHGPAVYVVRA